MVWETLYVLLLPGFSSSKSLFLRSHCAWSCCAHSNGPLSLSVQGLWSRIEQPNQTIMNIMTRSASFFSYFFFCSLLFCRHKLHHNAALILLLEDFFFSFSLLLFHIFLLSLECWALRLRFCSIGSGNVFSCCLELPSVRRSFLLLLFCCVMLWCPV